MTTDDEAARGPAIQQAKSVTRQGSREGTSLFVKGGEDRLWLTKGPKALDVVARGLALVLGAAALVGCLVKVFTNPNEVSVTVFVAGGLLLLVPSLVDRLESMAFASAKVSFVRQIAEFGAPKSAELFRRLGLKREIDNYAQTYIDRTGGSADQHVRVRALDRIVDRVSAAAAVEKFDRSEVVTLFDEGTPAMRVLALALMKGDISLVDSRVLDAIRTPLTANEQFHALDLVYRSWDRLPNAVRAEVWDAIEGNAHLKHGGDRLELVKKLRTLREADERRIAF